MNNQSKTLENVEKDFKKYLNEKNANISDNNNNNDYDIQSVAKKESKV